MVFAILMIMAWIVNLLTWVIPYNSPLTDQFYGCVIAATYERTNFCIFLIIQYHLLYLLKRVEYQINPKFDSADQVLRELRKNEIIERTYLSISGVSVIFILVISIEFIERAGGANTLDIIYFFVCFAFFVFNIFLIFKFSNMAFFYIKLLSYSDEVSVKKSKMIIVFNVGVIVISLFRYFVHG